MNTGVFHFVYFMFLLPFSLNHLWWKRLCFKKTLQKQMSLFFTIIYLLSISPVINGRPPPLALESLFFPALLTFEILSCFASRMIKRKFHKHTFRCLFNIFCWKFMQWIHFLHEHGRIWDFVAAEVIFCFMKEYKDIFKIPSVGAGTLCTIFKSR